ncbi:MAG: EAL domain-containing protein [Roseofilum sp. SBFL]|uniref:EAL domain-containing protein n=1 Tax=Roseofilum sp. SBFL TaxID=2821496 RepID=UPI001B0C1BE3|nr:EAL domain-containing protein [Roseofilum sp. SBFL]MBP0041043.1 EAL domain-containing protein [Roseofilum sp. SBFL]
MLNRQNHPINPLTSTPGWQRWIGGAFAALVLMGLEGIGLVKQLEQLAYRGLFQLRGEESWHSQVVIVGIDETTLKNRQNSDSPRQIYTTLLERLAPSQPRMVVLDILMHDRSPDDLQLAQAMRQVPVALPVSWDKQGNQKDPIPELAAEAVVMGHVVSRQDSDGLTRIVVPQLGQIPALGVAVANEVMDRPLELDRQGSEPLWINWPGSVNHLPQYELFEAIEGGVPIEEFRNKIVIVGANVTGFNPVLTPFDINPPASGIYVHAAVVSNALSNNGLQQVGTFLHPVWINLLYFAGAIGLSATLVFWSFRNQIIVVLGLGGVWLSMGYSAFHFYYLLPVVSPLVLLGLTLLLVTLQDRLKMKAMLVEQEKQLFESAFYDLATGLPNYALFMDRLEGVLSRTREQSQPPLFAVFFIYIDRSKVVNPDSGHRLSNELQVAISDRIEEALKRSMAHSPRPLLSPHSAHFSPRSEISSIPTQFTIARLDTDTFAVLVNALSYSSQAIDVAQTIYQTLSHASVSEGLFTNPIEPDEAIGLLEENLSAMTAFIGVALSAVHSDFEQVSVNIYSQAESMLRDAEIAMYQAKVKEGNHYAIFDQNLHHAEIQRLELELDLRRAINRARRQQENWSGSINNSNCSPAHFSYASEQWGSEFEAQSDFRLYYQPIVCFTTGRISGFEALVRWYHPTRGMVSPVDFIPLAEETGLIMALGDWILKTACYQLREWQNKFPHGLEVTMVVNLSSLQLHNPQLVSQIQTLLDEMDLDHRYLKLEITESGLMENEDIALDLLKTLREAGIQLSIDDFGTGYSSLARLHNLPVNTLKIDKSFLERTALDHESWEIIETIIILAHKLGLTVVAEGIETGDQFELLQRLSCDYGQGYWLSRPIDASGATALLAKNPQW